MAPVVSSAPDAARAAQSGASPREGLWRSIAYYGLSEFAQRATRIATTVMIARTLSPLDLGIAATAITVFEIVRIAANAGIGPAVVRASDETLAETCRTAHRLGWAICIGLAVFQVAIAGAVYAWTGRADAAAMIVALACVYLVMPAGLLPSYLLQREARHGTIAAVATTQAVADNVITIALALAGAGAWAIVLPKVLTSPIWLIGMRRARAWSPAVGNTPVAAFDLLRFAAPILAADLLSTARIQFDRIVVGACLGVEALGIYYFISNAGAGLSHALTTALSNSLYPFFAATGADPRALLSRLDDSLRRKAIPIAGVVLLQAACAPVYVPLLFGARWADVAWMVGTLCVAAACKVFADACAQALRAAGKPQLEFTGILAITIVSTVALAAGLQFGLPAGVVALAISHGLAQMIFAVLARRWLSASVTRS
jgi:O-antigen/teichoic acid export membrane protein